MISASEIQARAVFAETDFEIKAVKIRGSPIGPNVSAKGRPKGGNNCLSRALSATAPRGCLWINHAPAHLLATIRPQRPSRFTAHG